MTKESIIDRLTAVRPAEIPPLEREAMLARICQSPRTPLTDDPWQEQRRLHHKRTAMLAGAGAVAVAASCVGVALALSGNSTPHSPTASGSALRLAAPGTPAGSTVQARLMAAITDANTDVVETHTVISDGQTINQWSNGTGTLCRRVDSGYGTEPPEESLTTITSSGTSSTVLYPATKTWTTEDGTGTQPATGITPASIRGDIESGSLTVVGPGGTIDGHDTIELSLSAGHESVEQLWVDSSTYLPVRLALAPSTGVTGPSSQENWTYYAPTSQALSELTLSVPSNYTQESAPPPTIVPSTSGSAS